jgi:hypothetical protein
MKNIFYKKVRTFIENENLEIDFIHAFSVIDRARKDIDDLQTVKNEISELCSFLSGKKAFNELYIGSTVFGLEAFLELAIELNKMEESVDMVALLKYVKKAFSFVKDIFEECINEEIWLQLSVKQAAVDIEFAIRIEKIESNNEAA